jgi:membrane protease YdiL (CAAX protease family)
VSIFGVEPESPLPATGTATGLLLELIAGALIAPIAEEAVFRGFSISAWRRTVGDNGAIIRASLLFALAHVINVSGTTDQIVGLTVIGFVTRLPVPFVLGWLFVGGARSAITSTCRSTHPADPRRSTSRRGRHA